MTAGKDLVSIRNSVTKTTTACFEPSLDYCVVKVTSTALVCDQSLASRWLTVLGLVVLTDAAMGPQQVQPRRDPSRQLHDQVSAERQSRASRGCEVNQEQPELLSPRCGTRTCWRGLCSVGEVMAIGRTFEEAIQKAVRMVNPNLDGLDGKSDPAKDLESQIKIPTDRWVASCPASQPLLGDINRDAQAWGSGH